MVSLRQALSRSVYHTAFCMSGAVSGLVTFDLEPTGTGTRLKLAHLAVGEIDEASRASYGGGWKNLVATRLKTFVETGKRMGLGHGPPAPGGPRPA